MKTKSSTKNKITRPPISARPQATPKAAPTQTRRAPAAKPKRAAVKRKITKRIAGSRKATLEIPAILLEGDRPAPPPVSGPGEKFALGPTPLPQQFETEDAELPVAYGTGRLFLTARDPIGYALISRALGEL
jgi:hypothetical protein